MIHIRPPAALPESENKGKKIKEDSAFRPGLPGGLQRFLVSLGFADAFQSAGAPPSRVGTVRLC